MPVGFGADPTLDAQGKVLVGTTSSDIRKILGAMYTPGRVSGGVVTTSTTDTTYRVSAGVAVIPMATDENVIVNWPAVTNLTSGATNLPREEYIYVMQRTPRDDADSNVVVRAGTSVPGFIQAEDGSWVPPSFYGGSSAPKVHVLARYKYAAGADTSSKAVRAGDTDYSIPYGASRGELLWAQSTWNGPFTVRQTMFTREFTLPTDRLVGFNLAATVSATGSVKFSDNTYCEASWFLIVDGIQVAKWQSPGLHQAWVTCNFEIRRDLFAGKHTVTVDRQREAGPGTPQQHYIPSGAMGGHLTVTDFGVIR